MSRKKQKDEEKKEKTVFGSGAEPLPEPKDDGLVKCVCTVPCAWRGYHDEGDRVFVDRKLLESDPFFKGHFKRVDGVVAGAAQDGEDSAGNANGVDENADGGAENANGGAENADGGAENADGADGNADGQGELGLN